MQLSRRTEYGIRAMVCLAHAYQTGFLQTRELAAREKLPTKFLESILATLARGRFLISKIGATGGYRLARAPQDIHVADIIMRLEGRRLMDDETPQYDPSQRPGEVAVSIVESELSDAIRNALGKITLAQLLDQIAQRARMGQMYYI